MVLDKAHHLPKLVCRRISGYQEARAVLLSRDALLLTPCARFAVPICQLGSLQEGFLPHQSAPCGPEC